MVGTPRVRARGSYNAATRAYALTLSQHPPTAQAGGSVAVLPIPVKLALFSPHGDMLPLHREGQAAADGHEAVLVLDSAQQTFVFDQLDCAPIPSMLRGFSAPVILEYTAMPAES